MLYNHRREKPVLVLLPYYTIWGIRVFPSIFHFFFFHLVDILFTYLVNLFPCFYLLFVVLIAHCLHCFFHSSLALCLLFLLILRLIHFYLFIHIAIPTYLFLFGFLSLSFYRHLICSPSDVTSSPSSTFFHNSYSLLLSPMYILCTIYFSSICPWSCFLIPSQFNPITFSYFDVFLSKR